MNRFYVNKYPIRSQIYDAKTKENKDIKEGTIFTITGICGTCYELTPIKKIDSCVPVLIDVNMLESGFTASDTVGD